MTERSFRLAAAVDNGGRHRVVVIGGGFGGLQAATHLAREPVSLTLIDRRNFHLFQPLTYQVATGALSPGEVCYPLRAVFKRRRNVRVLLAEVRDFDLDAHQVLVEPGAGDTGPMTIAYDTLIVSGGSRYSYFGHDEWAEVAGEVKSLESALEVRGQILSAFEAAEMEPDPELRRAWLTFVVVGAGPTGVEMAGQIAELARDTLRRDFRAIDPRDGRILLVEVADRVLTGFPPSLSRKAARSLEDLGVTPLLERTVVGIDSESVTVNALDGSERIPARTVIWAAGVTASGMAAQLGELTGAELDRAGRVAVEPDLTLPGHPEVLALGDMVRVRGTDGAPVVYPGVAPVAMQEGRYAAKAVRARLRRETIGPFHYRDKGNLATIGRARAVADLHVIRLSGFPAWITWLFVHLWYLIGFQNRLLVFIRWSFSFFTRGRGTRIISPPAHRAARRSGLQRRQGLVLGPEHGNPLVDRRHRQEAQDPRAPGHDRHRSVEPDLVGECLVNQDDPVEPGRVHEWALRQIDYDRAPSRNRRVGRLFDLLDRRDVELALDRDPGHLGPFDRLGAERVVHRVLSRSERLYLAAGTGQRRPTPSANAVNRTAGAVSTRAAPLPRKPLMRKKHRAPTAAATAITVRTRTRACWNPVLSAR